MIMMWYICSFYVQGPLKGFTILLLNTATISPAGHSEVPWTIKEQVNKERPLCHVLSFSAESKNHAVSWY